MNTSRLRAAAKAAGVFAATAAVGLSTATPASAHSDRQHIEQMQTEYAAGSNVPGLMSGNVEHVRNIPGQVGISGCFMKTAPLFVTSGLDSVQVFNVSNPLQPRRVGILPNLVFENEAMNCGERKTATGTKRFALVGVDLYQASPNDPDHTNTGDGQELLVVDVTRPSEPRIRSRAPATTSTHTVACIRETDCRFAYSAGDRKDNAFSIFDLTDLNNPREVDSAPAKAGVQPFFSPTAAHKWNFDNAGYGTHTGFNGSAIFDVSRPRNPELVSRTGAKYSSDYFKDQPTSNGYNNFIHHNSFRPNAKAFRANTAPSLANGNVLLVTEEDYEQTDCSKAGSFQTWHVKTLNGAPGAIVPMDKVELADLGNYPLPQGAFCSAHWFDYHPSGVVAIGYYGGGTQLIDVRTPGTLKSYGHAFWGASEVWDSYWVPVYNDRGVATGRQTNITYSVDLIRGLDVYSVDLPGKAGSAETVALSSTSPFGAFSWPQDALPISLVALGFGAFLVLRRRAVKVESRS